MIQIWIERKGYSLVAFSNKILYRERTLSSKKYKWKYINSVESINIEMGHEFEGPYIIQASFEKKIYSEFGGCNCVSFLLTYRLDPKLCKL